MTKNILWIAFICLALLGDLQAAPAAFQIVDSEQASKPDGVQITKILPLPEDFPKRYRTAFDRYTQVIAPNGMPINLFAQKEISDSQLRRVRNVMVHYLTPLPNSEYGSDKRAIANQMAKNRAMMVVLKGSDGQFRSPRLPAQPLYEDETVVEGSDAYINNDFEQHRDATFEEILHCVHDNGIGVDVRRAPDGALPAYQKEIRAATTHAMKNKIWPSKNEGDTSRWIKELRDEGSLTQEYLASVIDSYYGFWGPFDEDAGMWGEYVARTRSDIKQRDPRGYAVVNKFFHPCLTFPAEIESTFEGTFSMAFDQDLAYTHKSQYLTNAYLTGSNHSNLIGNAVNNRLGGNAGDNRIDGGTGDDTVVFPHEKSRYAIVENRDGTTTVTGDGVDTLVNIEQIVFDGIKLREQQFVDPVPPNLR